MTTIAWDGRTMAGDRKSVFGNTPMVEVNPKICRIVFNGQDSIAGYAGSLVYCQRVLAWIKDGCPMDRKPEKEQEEDSFSVLVVNRTGVTYYNNRFYPENFGCKQWAIGSGCDYALGAMAAGVSAKRAVEIASKLDIYTGEGIDVLTLPKGAK